MKKFTYIAAAVLIASCVLTGTSSADIVQDSEATKVEEVSLDIVEISDNPELIDEQAASVPEPATFGLISLAIAVGGGLMVRRKTD